RGDRAALARCDARRHRRQQDARRQAARDRRAHRRAQARALGGGADRGRDAAAGRRGTPAMKALQLTREYPPHIYGGAGVVVDQLTRALKQRMKVEVRCFGARQPTDDGVVVRGYTPWERLKADASGEPRFAPALATLSIDLAMARDPVDADVAHAHTW